MPYKIAFISLGCAKNLVNTEQMMALCRKAGHTVTGDPEGADVAVLNTCGFIESAKSEAIDNILQLAELKKAGKLKKLLATGCLTQRYREDILAELPEVDGMLGTGSYTDVVSAVEELMAGERPEYFSSIHHTYEDGERLRVLRDPPAAGQIPQPVHGGPAVRSKKAGGLRGEGAHCHCSGHHPVWAGFVGKVLTGPSGGGAVQAGFPLDTAPLLVP